MCGFKAVILGAIALTFAIAGCSTAQKPGREQAATSPSSQRAAWDAVAKGAPLIDVRTEAEFPDGHLPGAVLIPYDEIASRLAELPADRSRTVVLYCRSGRRSGIAKKTLEDQGFTNVINAGGYEEMLGAKPD